MLVSSNPRDNFFYKVSNEMDCLRFMARQHFSTYIYRDTYSLTILPAIIVNYSLTSFVTMSIYRQSQLKLWQIKACNLETQIYIF